MRIGYYIHHTSLKAGGIFTYSVGILKLLIDVNEIDSIDLIIEKDQLSYFQKFTKSSKVNLKIINRNKLTTKIRLALSYFLFDIYILYNENKNVRKKLKILKRLSFLINPYKKFVNPKRIDLLHVPLQYSPIYGSKIPIIITMHDLQEFHYPEFFDVNERLHRAINNKKAILESDHIIVSFNHVKNDLLKYFNIAREKVSVCPPPFSKDWFATKEITQKEILEKKYGINEQFILYPAATWQHKNHINLIKSLKKLQEDGQPIQLICTGNKTDFFEKIKDVLHKLQMEEQVKFLGIIPESDLIGLYKNTSLVVIPTLYEAGSGPLYEAMRYGAPVICSNVTSLPETMGKDEFIFDPTDINEMSKLINRMLTNIDFKNENLQNSKMRMEKFIILNYGDNFLRTFNQLDKKQR